MADDLSVAILGGGNMGGALAEGLVSSQTASPSRIWVTDTREEILQSLQKRLGVRTGRDNAVAVRESGVSVLCVKPQQMEALLQEIRGAIGPERLVMAVAAGV
jgi:pyrroline-5-carboxylate reductase